MMEEDAVERPSETLMVGGFFVGALIGAYATWAGPAAALVVLAFGALGAVGAMALRVLSRVDVHRLVALLTEEER